MNINKADTHKTLQRKCGWYKFLYPLLCYSTTLANHTVCGFLGLIYPRACTYTEEVRPHN